MKRSELIKQIRTKQSFLCVGLDPDLAKIPKHLLELEDPVFEFNKGIIDATKDFGNVALPSYQLVDFFIHHSLPENNVTFYGSVTNIFNEDFQEIAGYTTRGRNYKIGVRLQF